MGAVVGVGGVEFALGTLYFAMQVVTFDVADEVAVDVDLVQMAGAVIQVVDGAPIRQGGGDAVAQWVVLVAKGALGGGFA